MKVLFLTPASDESTTYPDLDEIKYDLEKGGATVDLLDLTSLALKKTDITTLIDFFSYRKEDFASTDIVHSWSIIPLIARPLIPSILVVTLDPVNGPLRSFLPLEGEPGIVLLPVSACTDAVILLDHYRRILETHKPRDSRPWGRWESLRLMENYKVKHIYVAPGEKLSLQYHSRRREVWTVVAGNGTITVEEEVLPASPGKVFIIEKGQKHRAEGGPEGLHFIEVQTGDYLGEDDIVRLEDRYGRK